LPNLNTALFSKSSFEDLRVARTSTSNRIVLGAAATWHQGRRLVWRWKARSGRPPIPADLQRLIVTMARANPTWGEERLANELLLKLGLAVSPRTIGRYLRHVRPPRGGRPSQRWATCVRNHATAVLACDFFITVTACFRVLSVFVVLDVGTRRIVHWNVAKHPTAEWTIQHWCSPSPGDPPARCERRCCVE
jgi:putative transposase